MARPTYVYRLIVKKPEGSEQAGWSPPSWTPEQDPNFDPVYGDGSFRWPLDRLYLSHSGAEERARLFRRFGAEVEVERSLAVEWPAEPCVLDGCEDPGTEELRGHRFCAAHAKEARLLLIKMAFGIGPTEMFAAPESRHSGLG